MGFGAKVLCWRVLGGVCGFDYVSGSVLYLSVTGSGDDIGNGRGVDRFAIIPFVTRSKLVVAGTYE